MGKELRTTDILTSISSIINNKMEAELLLNKLENELASCELQIRINKGREMLDELNKRELSLRNEGISMMQKSGIESFSRGGIEVKIKTSPGRVVIKDPLLVPDEFIKETTKVTRVVKKKEIKEAMLEGEIFDWGELEQTVKLQITHK